MKKDENKTDSKFTKQSKSKSSAETRKTESTESKPKSTRRTSKSESSSSSDTGNGDALSAPVKSEDKKSSRKKLFSVEVSEVGTEDKSSSGHNDTRRLSDSVSTTKTGSRPYTIKSTPVSKKLESSLVKLVNENKDVIHYTNLSFGNSIVRILDVKSDEYFINCDDQYMMVNLKENSVKNFGDIFECGIDTMMNIPWES